MERLLGIPRRRILALLAVVTLVTALAGCQTAFDGRPWVEVSDEELGSLLGMYDQDLQMTWVTELCSETYGGREAGTEHEDLAGDYIAGLLESFGLEPWEAAGMSDYRHVFDLPSDEDPSENIIAVLPGKSRDNYLLIGAHYDHIGVINGVLHPGADDNALGTATVLEMARIFSQSEVTPEHSIVFVLFSGEEKGLIGSRALVEHLKQQKLDDQLVLLNLDVIAGTSGDTLIVFDGGYRENRVWSEKAKEEIEASGIEAEISRTLAGGVDSMRFTEGRIPGITLVWDDLRATHPHLHQPTDTPENLNLEIVDAATRAAIRVARAFAMR